VDDLRKRVLGAPELSSDGWTCYPGAIADFAQERADDAH
jgi:hypothetical protein